ncbi:MAG: hypothetical protein DWQ49_09580 [Bacteroidetes bacterium]|nr:MAG: hypothetical protein DWQ49_09580 [Bacteroidota bacterium]
MEELVKSFKTNLLTSIIGLSIALVSTISVAPDLVDFLPDKTENVVVKVSRLIVGILAGAGFMVAKDGRVTGGTVPATTEATKRTNGHS